MNKEYLDLAGSFECVVEPPGEAGWFGESGEKATPYIRIPLRVSDGPYRGKVHVWQGWLSDAAFDNTIRRLKEVFGFNGDLNSLYDGRQTLAGKPCNISTEMETYNGKLRCKVAWLNPPGGGGGAKPMDQAKLSSLLGRLSGRAKAVAATAQSKASEAQASVRQAASSASAPGALPMAAGQHEEDDVPF